MQARLFSYLDTQLTRLGGPNFAQIPINRPPAPVNDNLRDGFHQQAVHHGRTPYLPNAVGGGCPFLAGAEDGGYVHVPTPVEGAKVRERGPDDEYAPGDAVLEQHDARSSRTTSSTRSRSSSARSTSRPSSNGW